MLVLFGLVVMFMVASVAVTCAVLGATLGLFASAFAASEFQVIQFMPAFITPKILHGGLCMPREQMPEVLQVISDYLPLTHAIEAVALTSHGGTTAQLGFHVAVLAACSVAGVLLGASTLRRRSI